jgi:hypothetical protein
MKDFWKRWGDITFLCVVICVIGLMFLSEYFGNKFFKKQANARIKNAE